MEEEGKIQNAVAYHTTLSLEAEIHNINASRYFR
jgi:hypothetical protein